jgi:cytochrome c
MGNRAGVLRCVAVAQIAGAQMPLPPAKPTDGATLFKQQCATCHFTKLSEPVRQGPSLFRIVGRPAGKVDDFHYSGGFAKDYFAWDDAKLANPKAIIPGAIIAYRQPKGDPRRHHRQSQGAELNGKTRSLDGPRVRRGEIAGFLRARLRP